MSKSFSQDAQADVYWQGALLVASKRFSMAEASRQLGRHEETFGRFSRDHSGRWKALLRRANKVLRLMASAMDLADEVPEEHQEILREAASLKKDGVGWRETAERVGRPLGSLERMITRYERFWKELCRGLGMVDPRRAARGISDGTRDDIWRGFKMAAEERISDREASRRLGRGPEFLANCKRNHPEECEEASRAAGLPLTAQPESPLGDVRHRLDRAALIVASGVSKTQTARRLGLPPANLIANCKGNREYFEEKERQAGDLLAIPPGCVQRAVIVNESGVVVLIGDDGKVVKRGTGAGSLGRGLMPPVWDRRTGDLRYGRQRVRKVGPQARHVRLILDGFQELSWPRVMDDPLSGGNGDPVARLQEAVKTLNRGVKRLHFRTEGGIRVVWETRDN